jgi:hypothetical protein
MPASGVGDFVMYSTLGFFGLLIDISFMANLSKAKPKSRAGANRGPHNVDK